jgi:hypothetical protein
MENDEVVNLAMSLEELAERFPLKRKDPDDPGARIRSVFFIENSVLDFLACTRAAGVEPTCTEDRRIRGHRLPSGTPNVLPALWQVEVVKEPSSEIDSCVAGLLDLVHPRVERICFLLSTHRYRAGFLTSVTVFDEEPFYGLSSSTLRRLADFGLEWSLDVY